MKSITRQSGVTLMELVVTMAVIGILAAIGTPVIVGNIRAAKNSEAQNTLRSIFLMEKNYYADNNCYYVSNSRSNINKDLFGSLNNEVPITAPGSNDFVFSIADPAGQGSCPQSYQATAMVTGTSYSINEQFVKIKVVTDSQGVATTSSW